MSNRSIGKGLPVPDRATTSEDPMDHEYDAQDADDVTDKTDQDMASPPDGPNAAHFREAARLAAARARKALEANVENDARSSEKNAKALVSDDFKKAATKHARSVSGRSRNALKKKADKAAATTMELDSKADESIALLDERLHLGARMLRAFESQIQRLEEAGADLDGEALEAGNPGRLHIHFDAVRYQRQLFRKVLDRGVVGFALG